VSEKRKTKLTKAELLEKLKKCALLSDTEKGHQEADQLLVAYINDRDITIAYNKIEKWYA